MDKIVNAPVVKPFVALLFSRKFILALVTVLVMFGVSFEPRLANVAPVLIIALTTVISVVIHGIAKEDSAEKLVAMAIETIGYASANPMTPESAEAELKTDVKASMKESADAIQ